MISMDLCNVMSQCSNISRVVVQCGVWRVVRRLYSPRQVVETDTDRRLHSDEFDDKPVQYDPSARSVDPRLPYRLPAESQTIHKRLHVAVLGSPNAGKSLLINALSGTNVCAVSKKVHTTRHVVRSITLEGDTQMIYLDTPGIVSPASRKKHNLDASLMHDPETSVKHAEVIAVVMDAADHFKRNRLDLRVLFLLHRHMHTPSVLVLNKTDLVKNKDLLLALTETLCAGVVDGQPTGAKVSKLLRIAPQNHPSESTVVSAEFDYSDARSDLGALLEKPMYQINQAQMKKVLGDQRGWPHFSAVFMVSALTGDGMDELKQFLLSKAKVRRPAEVSSAASADQISMQLVLELVRGKLLDNLTKDIPYKLGLHVAVWELNEHDVLCIRLDVICPHKRLIKVVIGQSGEKIRKISAEASQELRNLFQRDVYLKLNVC